jgi:hypothetical protein
MRTSGNALILMGRDDDDSGALDTIDNRHTPHSWGTRYAVTTFLEDRLGVRYLWPGESGKVVPKQATIAVDPIDMAFTPSVRQRKMRVLQYGERVQRGLDWLAISKQEYLRLKDEGGATRAASATWMGWHRMGGSLGVVCGDGALLPEALWRKWPAEHPGWFAQQRDGSRDQMVRGSLTDRPRLCVSNPDLIEAVAQVKIDELTRNPGQKSVSIEVHDGGYIGFCMCDACKALDVPEARACDMWSYDHKTGKTECFEYVALSDRYVHFWNAIAERVTKVFPEALLCASQYSVYSAPPLKHTLHPNIIVRFVGEWYFRDEGPGSRKMMMDDWKAWSSIASKIFFRPNVLYLGYKSGSPLASYVHKLAEDLRYMAHHALLGTDFDGCLDMWATQGLNYYVLAEILWDPDQDVDALIDDYCVKGFGAGWRHVRTYWNRVEQLTDRVAAEKLELLDVYTAETIVELGALLDAAEREGGADPEVRRRVAFLRRGLDFTALQAEAHRLCARLQANTPDAAARSEAQRLLDRKWLFMRRSFQAEPYAIDAALNKFYEASFTAMGGMPSAEVRASVEAQALPVKPRSEIPDAGVDGRPLDGKPAE